MRAHQMTMEFHSCVRDYHIYKDVWNPSVGDDFSYQREEENLLVPYVVAVAMVDTSNT